jgi:hypothetical protein
MLGIFSFFAFIAFVYIIFSLLSLKRRSEACKVIVYLSVSPPLITYEPIGKFLLNQEGGHATEGKLDAIFFDPIVLTIPKWRTFKFLRWMQNLNQSVWGRDYLYADRSLQDEQLVLRQLL